MTDRGIATKIVGLTLAVASLLAFACLIGLFNIRSLAHQQDRQYHTNVVALSLMTTIRAAVGAQQEAVLGHILSGHGFYQSQCETKIDFTDGAIRANLSDLHQVDLTLDAKDLLTSFESTLDAWRIDRDSALRASRLGDRALASAIVFVRSVDLKRAVEIRADAFLKHLMDAVALSTRQSLATSRQAMQLMLVALAAGTCVGILLSFLAARAISSKLRQAVDVLARVADGDFSQRMSIASNDELGQMGRSLNDTVLTLQKAFASLRHSAFHDSLTGLANRKLFNDRLAAALAIENTDKHVAVLFVDLDGFKQVNDANGHDVGDALLVAVASKICEQARSVDTVARLGGDEFAVVLGELDQADDARIIAHRILQNIQLAVQIGGLCITPAASIGVAVRTSHTEVEELVRQADTAMYKAKSTGKGTVVVFDDLPACGAILDDVGADDAGTGMAPALRHGGVAAEA